MSGETIERQLDTLINSSEQQFSVLKEIADFLSNKTEITNKDVNKNEMRGEIGELRREYERLGQRLRALEEYAAMYNCWGYHE